MLCPGQAPYRGPSAIDRFTLIHTTVSYQCWLEVDGVHSAAEQSFLELACIPQGSGHSSSAVLDGRRCWQHEVRKAK